MVSLLKSKKLYMIRGFYQNCTTFTDGRNGRNMVQISKRKYIEKYGSLSHESIKIDEHKNEHGQLHLASNRMVVTCPVRLIQGKVAEKGYTISLGKVLSLQPFFVKYPTEKELPLCLCKLCLNSKLLFEPILVQAKKVGDISKSLTEFFMPSYSCPKAVNGFYQWKYVSLKCKECKDAKPQFLSCQEDDTLVKISQFEKVTSEYVNKKKETKKSNKTERVEHQLSFRDIFKKLNKIKKEYITHKFQVFNDKAHWPTILETNTHGEIEHMDFSENLTQLFKYEPQSSHFNKSQYSLHCTVKHTGLEESPYHYLYHLSNVMQHDHTFTSVVVNEIIKSTGIPEIIHFKSDNCSAQYKCKWIFQFWNNLVKKLSTKVIIYYGVSGHG